LKLKQCNNIFGSMQQSPVFTLVPHNTIHQGNLTSGEPRA
jgi:hypothetical protein